MATNIKPVLAAHIVAPNERERERERERESQLNFKKFHVLVYAANHDMIIT